MSKNFPETSLGQRIVFTHLGYVFNTMLRLLLKLSAVIHILNNFHCIQCHGINRNVDLIGEILYKVIFCLNEHI